jgi:hypothetical protein
MFAKFVIWATAAVRDVAWLGTAEKIRGNWKIPD